eukprot:UN10135
MKKHPRDHLKPWSSAFPRMIPVLSLSIIDHVSWPASQPHIITAVSNAYF